MSRFSQTFSLLWRHCRALGQARNVLATAWSFQLTESYAAVISCPVRLRLVLPFFTTPKKSCWWLHLAQVGTAWGGANKQTNKKTKQTNKARHKKIKSLSQPHHSSFVRWAVFLRSHKIPRLEWKGTVMGTKWAFWNQLPGQTWGGASSTVSTQRKQSHCDTQAQSLSLNMIDLGGEMSSVLDRPFGWEVLTSNRFRCFCPSAATSNFLLQI